MQSKKIISLTGAVLQAKILRRRIPFAVSWALTYRCNAKCLYCRIQDIDLKELGIKEILSILDELAAMGTRWISFTGGEPLLRDDIGEIIDYITTSLNNNNNTKDA